VNAKVRSQPLQLKEIKISSTVCFTGFTRGLSSQLWIFNKTSKVGTFVQYAKSREKHPRQAVSKLQIKEGIFRLCCILKYKKGISQWSKVSPKTALQGLSPDGLHGREP
jgi:hypothetical protein